MLSEYSALDTQNGLDFGLLFYALEKGNTSLFMRLGEYEIFDFNFKIKDKPSLLELAISQGNVEATRYLMGKGAIFIVKNGKTPLICASELEYYEMVRFMVEEIGEDINARDH